MRFLFRTRVLLIMSSCCYFNWVVLGAVVVWQTPTYLSAEKGVIHISRGGAGTRVSLSAGLYLYERQALTFKSLAQIIYILNQLHRFHSPSHLMICMI